VKLVKSISPLVISVIRAVNFGDAGRLSYCPSYKKKINILFPLAVGDKTKE
jgi:hypothetical protein